MWGIVVELETTIVMQTIFQNIIGHCLFQICSLRCHSLPIHFLLDAKDPSCKSFFFTTLSSLSLSSTPQFSPSCNYFDVCCERLKKCKSWIMFLYIAYVSVRHLTLCKTQASFGFCTNKKLSSCQVKDNSCVLSPIDLVCVLSMLFSSTSPVNEIEQTQAFDDMFT